MSEVSPGGDTIPSGCVIGICILSISGVNGFGNIKCECLTVQSILPAGKNTCDNESISIVSRNNTDILCIDMRADSASLGKCARCSVSRLGSKAPSTIAVTKSSHLISSIVVTASRTGVGSISNLSTSRLSYSRLMVVTEGCYFYISSIVASRAGLIRVPTDFGTSRSLCFVTYSVMIKSRLFCISSIVAS